MEPTPGVEPGPAALRDGCTDHRAALAWSRRSGSNRLPPGYRPGAPTRGASPAWWCPRRDSNAHQPGSRPDASTVGLRGQWAGGRGFEPLRAGSEPAMLPGYISPQCGRSGRRSREPPLNPSRSAPGPDRHQRRPSTAHVGATGSIRNLIPASAGVWSPLRWLQPPHAATVLAKVFFPPRERGVTWSIVEACPPQ